MSIQWFPGHMHAAQKKAAQTMAKVDMVMEVLDARIPQASGNPMIEKMRNFRQRPCLKILNKSDLADPIATNEWIDFYNRQQNVNAIPLNSKNLNQVSKIVEHCLALVPHRGTALKPLRIMIMGIPNVGKSTLMNALLKRRIAKVGNEPAVTKMEQRLYFGNNIVLIDTPGLMWPKIVHSDDGFMLAASHAIGSNALIEEEVAIFLANVLLRRYAPQLAMRYRFNTQNRDGVAVIEAIAAQRGYTLKGGAPDFEKAARTLLQDYRNGHLGRISLETPSTRAAMLAQVCAPVGN